MKKRTFLSKGFTLLELLVVISIIGILIALGTASYSTAQKKGRDAKRQADINAVQNALEQYNSLNNGTYPIAANCSDADMLEILPNGFPTDPKTGNDYYRFCTSDAYCICAQLDQAETGNATTAPTDETCNYGSGGDFFCKSNLQ